MKHMFFFLIRNSAENGQGAHPGPPSQKNSVIFIIIKQLVVGNCNNICGGKCVIN